MLTQLFKVYMADVDLLRRKYGLSHKTILEKSELYDNFKGALTENFALNELLAQGGHPYFWRSGNTAELDFIFENEGRLIPVEAKASLPEQKVICSSVGNTDLGWV